MSVLSASALSYCKYNARRVTKLSISVKLIVERPDILLQAPLNRHYRGMKIPYILLAAPISKKKDYILKEWLSYIRQLSYPSYDIYLVDNSKRPGYDKHISDTYGIRCGRVDPTGKRAPNFIAESQNMLRNHFLEGSYTHFFSLECDNFPPPNIIEFMLSFKKDNFNIPYFLKRGEEQTLGVQRSIINYQGHCNNKVMGPNDSIRHFDGKVRPYFAPSLGCTLLTRKLVEQIRFRVSNSNPMAFSDSFFHWDSNKLGIKPFVHMGQLCEHHRFTWAFNNDLIRAS